MARELRFGPGSARLRAEECLRSKPGEFVEINLLVQEPQATSEVRVSLFVGVRAKRECTVIHNEHSPRENRR